MWTFSIYLNRRFRNDKSEQTKLEALHLKQKTSKTRGLQKYNKFYPYA